MQRVERGDRWRRAQLTPLSRKNLLAMDQSYMPRQSLRNSTFSGLAAASFSVRKS